jgi:hypothetical protein
MNMKKYIIALALIAGMVSAVEMQVPVTTNRAVEVVDLEVNTYAAIFKDGVPYKYIINFSGLDASSNVVGRASASFTPAEAAYIFPQLGDVMGGVDTAINANKEMIIQKSK